MTNNKKNIELKKAVAQAALQYIPKNSIVGIGTGSTVNLFIEELYKKKINIKYVVSSSIKSTNKLLSLGFKVLEIDQVEKIDIYIDGADYVKINKELIKGKGGALTREKMCVNLSKKFICIVDSSKLVKNFNKIILPIEVIPIAINFVTKEVKKYGGKVIYRNDFFTDNNNIILDIHDLIIKNSIDLENSLNNILGIVSNGIFSINKAHKLLIATSSKIRIL